MSPVARRQGGGHTGRAVLVAVVGVVLAFGVAYGVATLASTGDVEVNLGDERFEVGNAENLARIIRDDGGPVLFPDPANFTRPIYVDHTGDEPDTGWTAFSAFVPDQPDCTITFDRDTGTYRGNDTCDEPVTFPRSGAGLRQFATEVVDGSLFVDLRRPGSQQD